MGYYESCLLEEFTEYNLALPSSFKEKVDAYPRKWSSVNLAYWDRLFTEYGHYPTWHEVVVMFQGKQFTDEEYYSLLQFWCTDPKKMIHKQNIPVRGDDQFTSWLFLDGIFTLAKWYPYAREELEPLFDLYQAGEVGKWEVVAHTIEWMKEKSSRPLMEKVAWFYEYHSKIHHDAPFTIARYYEDLTAHEIF